MRCVILAVLVLAALAGVLPGCAAPPSASGDPLAAAPEDFALEVILRCDRKMPTAAQAPPAPPAPQVHQRPGRFIFLPDGSLHYAASGRPDGPEPERKRMLSRRQVAELWSLAHQLGLADPEAGQEPINLDLIQPPPGGMVCLIAVTGHDRRWMFIDAAAAGEAPNPASVAIVRHLAELAWVSDEPEGRVMIIPRRYDFGPDPYARYRRP
jgi:hypothetical protein